jgi:predicted porin
VFATVAYYKADDATSNAVKNTFVGGTYDFHFVKAHAAWGKTTPDLNTVDHKIWMLGVTVPVGQGAILGAYTHVKNDLAPSDGTGYGLAIGYTYALSKRTNLYTSYSHTSNDANSNAGGLAAANGENDSMFNVGIRHTF